MGYTLTALASNGVDRVLRCVRSGPAFRLFYLEAAAGAGQVQLDGRFLGYLSRDLAAGMDPISGGA